MSESDPPGKRPRRRASASKRAAGEVRGRLRPHDPFELIRWLALSQPDPRKALSELVQNSLDASARTIHITRRRERGVPCLFLNDDGAGVIPELDRPQALKYIATHIGHSRKRSLSPRERLTLMTQGQYGIGLLGFWSLGETLEMRTAVPGQRPHRLVLRRDSPDYRIEPLRGRLTLDERWTEIAIVGLHREAQSALVGRRAADYLAAELRGQLLAREVDVVVEDRMSRGRAQKVIQVRPPKFLGERLEGLGPIDVPGYEPIRFEVYLSGSGETGSADEASTGLAVYSAGTLVAENFHALAAHGLDRAPWIDQRLSGIVDFPSFRVAPGSRRGVVMDEAAGAFARALTTVEPILSGLLEALERRRTEELDKTLIRDLQRAFRDFYKHRPRYSMLPVREEEPKEVTGGGSGEGEQGAVAAEGAGTAEEDLESTGKRRSSRSKIDLLPPGALDAVQLTPSQLRVECRGRRRVRAVAVDAIGRALEEPVDYQWDLEPAIGALEIDGALPGRVVFNAGEVEGQARLTVTARAGGIAVTAEAEVDVLELLPSGRGNEGIPEPELVHYPSAPWRSRMDGERWQVNSGHREYRAVAQRPSLKLRYLAMLFAKEVVLRSHQDPRFEQPLEQLVEIAGYADRRLSTRGRKARQRDE